MPATYINSSSGGPKNKTGSLAAIFTSMTNLFVRSIRKNDIKTKISEYVHLN